jgi:activating signal cointegrator complex subunit 1
MPPSPRLTHFLCIPLVTPASRPQLQASLQSFRNEVAAATALNPSGIPERAVRPAGTLHLTLGVMSLLTPARVEAALTLLRSLDLRGQMPSREGQPAGSLGSRPAPLTITLRGLNSMRDPATTSVLYAAPVDEDGSLYEFCRRLQRAFQEADLVVPEARPLLLHATIINTVYVQGRARGSGKGKGRAPRLTINATDMLHKYEDFEWMRDIGIEKVAICKMGAIPVGGGDEEYVVEGEVHLP